MKRGNTGQQYHHSHKRANMNRNAKLRKSSRLRRESKIEAVSEEESGSDRESRRPKRGQQKTQKIIDKLSNSYMDSDAKCGTYDADVDSRSTSSESVATKSPQVYDFEDMTEDVCNLQLALSPERKQRVAPSKGRSKKQKENLPKKLQEQTNSKDKLSRGVKEYLQKERCKKHQGPHSNIMLKSPVLAEKGINSTASKSQEDESLNSRASPRSSQRLRIRKNTPTSAIGDSGVFSPQMGTGSFVEGSDTPDFDDTPTSTPSILVKTKFKKVQNEKSNFLHSSPMLSPVERCPNSDVRGKFVTSPADEIISQLDMGSPNLRQFVKRTKKTKSPQLKNDTTKKLRRLVRRTKNSKPPPFEAELTESDEGFLSLNKSGSTFEGMHSVVINSAKKSYPTKTEIKGKKRSRKVECETMEVELFDEIPEKRSAKRKTKPSSGPMKTGAKKQKKVSLSRQESYADRMAQELEEIDEYELSIE